MSDVKRYKVQGAWVDEPFVTFDHAEMVLYSDYAALEAERDCAWKTVEQRDNVIDALQAQVERLTAPVSFSYDEINELCCEFGAPEYRRTDDGEGWYWGFLDSELPVADNLAELLFAARKTLAARASQPQTYESALRTGMRQNYAQEADRAVDKLLDEKERI